LPIKTPLEQRKRGQEQYCEYHAGIMFIPRVR
jgi:hypothetical protein